MGGKGKIVGFSNESASLRDPTTSQKEKRKWTFPTWSIYRAEILFTFLNKWQTKLKKIEERNASISFLGLPAVYKLLFWPSLFLLFSLYRIPVFQFKKCVNLSLFVLDCLPSCPLLWLPEDYANTGLRVLVAPSEWQAIFLPNSSPLFRSVSTVS